MNQRKRLADQIGTVRSLPLIKHFALLPLSAKDETVFILSFLLLRVDQHRGGEIPISPCQ